MRESFALICDKNGIIKKILINALSRFNVIKEGESFTKLLASESYNTILKFFSKVSNSEEFIINDSKDNCFYIGGQMTGDDVLIVGAYDPTEFESLFEKVMEINNEYNNQLRMLSKEVYSAKSLKDMASNEEVDQLYSKIAKLNNELVNTQRELTKKNFELENLNRLKNKFLGMAAHDINNPLWIIQNYSEILLELNDTDEDADEKKKKYLKNINTSTELIFHIIRNFLDVSLIESGKLEMMYEITDIVELLEENVSMNNLFATKKNIKINLIKNIDSLKLNIDRDKIYQVLNNVVGNSIKYSHRNSEIVIYISKTNLEAVISVKDSGIGMTPEDIENLFKPFAKMAESGTAKERSTGLGLAIAKHIIDAHNGRIFAESAKDKGSTFHIALPIIQV